MNGQTDRLLVCYAASTCFDCKLIAGFHQQNLMFTITQRHGLNADPVQYGIMIGLYLARLIIFQSLVVLLWDRIINNIITS